MIRFSAFLVVVAVGLLVAGVVTSKLLLVYIAIGVSGVALLALGIGGAVNWRELTGKPKTAAAETSAQGPTPAPQPQPQAQAQVPAGPSATGPGPSAAGHPRSGGIAAEVGRYGGRRGPRRVRLARRRSVRPVPGWLPAHRPAAESPALLGHPLPVPARGRPAARLTPRRCTASPGRVHAPPGTPAPRLAPARWNLAPAHRKADAIPWRGCRRTPADRGAPAAAHPAVRSGPAASQRPAARPAPRRRRTRRQRCLRYRRSPSEPAGRSARAGRSVPAR